MRKSLLLLASLLAGTVAWGLDASGWNWKKTFSAEAAAAQARVSLDAEVYGGAREDLADLRVMAPGGAETPFALEVEKDDILDAPSPARLYNLSRTPDYDTRFELDLGENPQLHNYLYLDIAPESHDFRRMVKLEGLDDARRWNLLKEGGSILDFSESFRLRYTELYYPESHFRYLRVTILDHGAEPVKVNGASVRRHVHRAGQEEERLFQVSESSTGISRVLELDFGHDKVPVRRLTFATGAVDFRRRVAVSVLNPDGKTWRQAAEGAIYRYRTPRFAGEALELKFPELRCRRLRVEIFHYNDRPVKIRALKAYGFARRLRFKDLRPGAYTLYYGSPSATAPRYDLAESIAYLPEGGIKELRLLPQEANPNYEPPQGPWSEEHPWILRLALCAAILALGALVLRQWQKT